MNISGELYTGSLPKYPLKFLPIFLPISQMLCSLQRHWCRDRLEVERIPHGLMMIGLIGEEKREPKAMARSNTLTDSAKSHQDQTLEVGGH